MTAVARDTLFALLRGQASSLEGLANALRVEALGRIAFGRTDALDLFAGQPVALSGDALVLSGPGALAVLDTDADGHTVGVFADLCGAVVSRVWLVGPVPADARSSIEPAVRVASDDFMTQLREPLHGDAADHPALAPTNWPHVESMGRHALAEVQRPPAASSSHAVVLRAFSDGSTCAALYALRVQAHAQAGGPRTDHHRWALAACRVGADGALLHHRLALSQAWPAPAPVSF